MCDALSILGEREVRPWVPMVVTLAAGQNKSSEIVLSALVRARFCELLMWVGLGRDLRNSAFRRGNADSLEHRTQDRRPRPSLRMCRRDGRGRPSSIIARG